MQVNYITSRRFEKVVWLAADPRLTYGEVASDTSNLALHTPGLVVFLATTSQTGPIDPIEMAKTHPLDSAFFLCPPRNASSHNAVLATD
jgi:hypothetical protein